MNKRLLETPLTLKGALLEGTKILEEAKVPEAKLDAWLLLEYTVKVDRSRYYLEPDKELSPKESALYIEAIEKRAGRIPLQHITGEQEFMGFPFRVNPHVLIPRQDTEILVETALEKAGNGMRILDMCTGSGCIIISLGRMLCDKNGQSKGEGQNVELTGCDISEEALETARENAARLGADARFIKSDLFENIEGKYDMIVSNPPYIPTARIGELEDEVRLHDPMLALDGREDGLYFYRKIIEEAKGYLTDKGWLLFEIGSDQREDVEALMEEAGYTSVAAKKDLAGLDRVVMGRYNKA